MSDTNVCPDCGAGIPASAPAGQCPQCMIKAGFASDEPLQSQFAETASAGNLSDFEPPAIEQLAELFSQIEVLELLGKGGMGAVYKARQPALDRLVAVKILPPEIGRNSTFAERFTREARALARLSHPNIVAIHDIGQADELLYFVMEYVDGVNLRQAIQAGLLTQNEALAVVPCRSNFDRVCSM